MLDLRSLNEHQKQTLLEFQNGIAAGETGEDIETKEKRFRNMLSEVKFRSDNMRRKKLHQKPQKQMKPQVGQPSFMSSKDSLSDIEEILKKKVDQKTIKDFLGTS